MKYITLLLLFWGTLSYAQVNQTDSQGRKQGVWKKAYPNAAAFIYVGQFKDDKPYGEFTYFYESGIVKAKINFQKDGSTTYAKLYHETGYLMAKGKYVNQEKDSIWIQFDDRGVVSYQEEYKNGKLDGQRVVFFEPVGNQYLVMEYYYYKNGVRHGEFKKFHPNKKLAQEGNYIDGNLNGDIKHYHPNGNIARIERYKYAVKHGYQIVFDEKGIQVGYKLYWEGKELKGEALAKKEAELKANRPK